MPLKKLEICAPVSAWAPSAGVASGVAVEPPNKFAHILLWRKKRNVAHVKNALLPSK